MMKEATESLAAPTLRQKTWVTSGMIGYTALVVVSLVAGVCLLLFDPVMVLGVAGVAVMIAVQLYTPFAGILIYLVFEYARIHGMFPSLMSLQLGKLIIVPTLLIWLITRIATRAERIITDRVNWLMLLWLALAFGGSFLARDSNLALNMTLDLAKWVVIYFLIVNLVNSLPKWQWFIWVFLLLNFKMSQFQIRGFITGIGSAFDQSRFIADGVGAGSTAFFANATDFGAAMCIAAPFAFYLIKAVRSPILKAIAVIIFLFFVTSILQSGSRGAALGLFAMAFVYWLGSSRKVLTGLLALVFVGGFWLAAPEAWKARFVSGVDYEQDATASSRIRFWKAGAEMMAGNPATGVGIGNFGANYAPRYGQAPHSIFVQAGAELGLPGLLNMLLIFYLIVKRNRETRRLHRLHKLKDQWIPSFATALDFALLAFVVTGAFLTILYYPHCFMVISLTVALNHITKKQVARLTAATPAEPAVSGGSQGR
jgi:probable O-glycosylation ligase (exosortase A-associated)